VDRQKSRVCPETIFSPTVLKWREVTLFGHHKFFANFVLERTPKLLGKTEKRFFAKKNVIKCNELHQTN